MTFRDSLDAEFRSMLTGEFADDALVRESFERVVHVRGIFDSTYLEIDPGTGATIASKKPRITVFEGDVSFEIVQGAIVTVAGVSYRVRDIQPDGLESASLYLDPAKPSDTVSISSLADDAPQIDDLLVNSGEGLFPATETIEISDPLEIATVHTPSIDLQQVDPTYSGDFAYSGAFDYGATAQASIDKAMTMTVTRLGVTTEEVLV